MTTHAQRSWLSPFVAITFIAVSLTGILMLFHIRLPGMYPIHEWGGVLFVIAGGVHLLFNCRVFGNYFKKKQAIVGLCAGMIALLFIALLVPSNQHGSGHNYGGKGGAGYQSSYHAR